MPFEAPLLREPVLTPPLIGCAAENIENFVDTEQLNSGFVLFISIQRRASLCNQVRRLNTEQRVTTAAEC